MSRTVKGITAFWLLCLLAAGAVAWQAADPVAPEGASWAILEREGGHSTFSRKRPRVIEGSECFWVWPPEGGPRWIHKVRDDCRARVVRVTPGQPASWEQP